MKTMKKLGAFLLALVMILSLSVTAFGAVTPLKNNDADGRTDKGSITINDAEIGQTYTVYRVLRADIDENAIVDGHAPTTYYVLNTDPFYTKYMAEGSVLPTYFDMKLITGTTNKYEVTPKTDARTYLTTSLDPATLGLDGYSITVAAGDNDQAIFKAIPYGYYFMKVVGPEKDSQGVPTNVGISLSPANPDAVMNIKISRTPSNPQKVVNDDSVKIGQTLYYQSSFKATNYVETKTTTTTGTTYDTKQIMVYNLIDTPDEDATTMQPISFRVFPASGMLAAGKDAENKAISNLTAKGDIALLTAEQVTVTVDDVATPIYNEDGVKLEVGMENLYQRNADGSIMLYSNAEADEGKPNYTDDSSLVGKAVYVTNTKVPVSNTGLYTAPGDVASTTDVVEESNNGFWVNPEDNHVTKIPWTKEVTVGTAPTKMTAAELKEKLGTEIKEGDPKIADKTDILAACNTASNVKAVAVKSDSGNLVVGYEYTVTYGSSNTYVYTDTVETEYVSLYESPSFVVATYAQTVGSGIMSQEFQGWKYLDTNASNKADYGNTIYTEKVPAAKMTSEQLTTALTNYAPLDGNEDKGKIQEAAISGHFTVTDIKEGDVFVGYKYTLTYGDPSQTYDYEEKVSTTPLGADALAAKLTGNAKTDASNGKFEARKIALLDGEFINTFKPTWDTSWNPEDESNKKPDDEKPGLEKVTAESCSTGLSIRKLQGDAQGNAISDFATLSGALFQLAKVDSYDEQGKPVYVYYTGNATVLADIAAKEAAYNTAISYDPDDPEAVAAAKEKIGTAMTNLNAAYAALWTKDKTKAANIEADNLYETMEFQGLDAGEYRLTETKAPTGYSVANPIDIKLTHNAANAKHYSVLAKLATATEYAVTDSITLNDNNFFTDIVIDSPAPTMPETGGIGTTIFRVAGTVLVLGAAILLVTKKRAEKKAA